MVRPKKDAAKPSTEDKTLSVPLSEYLKANNTVATALDVFHTMATSAMQGASHNLNCINACMASLQSSTQASLSANKLTIDAIDPEQYGAIIRILTMEKDSFNPMANVVNYQLPFAAPTAKPADVKVKREKKPKVPRDPNAPKRPLTAYLHYYHENRDLLKARLEKEIGPDVTKGQIQEEGKNVWNAMPDTDKEVYKAAYRAKWQVYQQELLDYQKKGGPVDPKLLAAVDPDAAPQADVEEDEDEEEAEEEEEELPKVIEDSSSEEEEEEEEEAEEEKPQTPPPSSKKSKAKAAPKASQKEESASSKKKAAAAAPADNTTTATPAKKSRKAAAPKEDAAAPETFSTKKRKANGQDAAPAAAKKSKKSKGDEEAAKAERRQKR